MPSLIRYIPQASHLSSPTPLDPLQPPGIAQITHIPHTTTILKLRSNMGYIVVGEPATKLMHPKYTNVKYVFLYIKIYEKHDFKASQAKLATDAWFFYIYVYMLKTMKIWTSYPEHIG